MKKNISFLVIGAMTLLFSISPTNALEYPLNNNDINVFAESNEVTTDVNMSEEITINGVKPIFTPNSEFVDFLDSTNRKATVTQTDKGIRILVYNNNDNPSGNGIPYLTMIVPSGWQVTYSTETEFVSPKTVGEGTVFESNFIYYVMVEKTGDFTYTDDEILNWYLSMGIENIKPLTTTTVTTNITTTTVVTTTTPYIPEQLKGDANSDDKLNIRDAAFIARKLAEQKSQDIPELADYNEDNVVDIRDASAIARNLAKYSITNQ
jgi:hypothetical protein